MKNHSLGFKFLFFYFSILFINTRLFAQSAVELNLQLSSPQLSDANYSLQQLSRGVVPTTYFKERVKTISDSQTPSVRIITDVESLNLLYSEIANSAAIEIIQIQIKDEKELNWKLNVNALKHFINLKYIYISSSINLCELERNDKKCVADKINSLVSEELKAPILLIYSSELSE